ncbi:bifunctional Vacuolar ATP synthase subunit C superfamily/ATPase [Babesia duncani]|uniref:V-type proton ATPase subunit C n=1 Tax=Babesia duncani TaxID=323732 RepID=A0AAD9PID1_9APIC|nr:bifunctional Vacuolar ATP synthase subunit C superfamily/ATPase [Babesia duncani]
MSQCLFVACKTENNESREELFALLRKQLQKSKACTDVGVLQIPKDLRFTTFDDLLRCADELEKEDQVVEMVLKRSEQLAREVDSITDVCIYYQGANLSVTKYLQSFEWDEGRFPKYNPIGENLKNLSQLVKKMGEDVGAKATTYADLNSKRQALKANDDCSNIYRDLVYIITPEVIQEPSDFIESEHLTTIIVYVSVGSDADFLRRYMQFAPNIVPLSAKKLPIDLKSYSLYRVVMFKTSVEAFLKQCEANAIVAKQFIYKPEVYQSILEERSKLEVEANRQEVLLSRIFRVAYSDLFICWIHLKIMRVYCESILRFGIGSAFSCFFIRFLGNENITTVRKILNDLLCPNSKSKQQQHDEFEDGNEYYSYVSFRFSLGRG